MPEIFEELDRQADKWEPTAAAISLGSLGLGAGISTTAIGAPIGGIIAGVGLLPSLVIDGYQAGRGWYKTFKESPSPRVNAMRKRQVDVVLNLQKKEATEKLAKRGVRSSQGSYFTSKLNLELNKPYLELVAKRNTIIANDVTKLSPKILLPILIIPNIIDIHAKNK